MSHRHLSCRRPGATIVESAAVISVFLLLLFGLFEYGRFIMTKQLLENAAREGARYAVVHTYDGTVVQIQNQADLKMSAARSQLQGYDKTVNIRVYATDASGTEIGGKTWSDSAFSEGIGVEITGSYRPILPNFMFMNSNITVRAKSVMSSEAN